MIDGISLALDVRKNILVSSCQFESVTPHAIHFHCCVIEKRALVDRMNPEKFHFHQMEQGNGYILFYTEF